MIFIVGALLVTVRISSAVLYNGKYFDPKDRINAECVVKKAMKDYVYFGNQDKSIDGETCAQWNKVTESWFSVASNAEKQLKQPSESFIHSKCRNIKLSISHPMYNASSNTNSGNLEITSGKNGPWCFINQDGANGVNHLKYKPAICFNPCDETKIVIENERKRVTENGYTVLKLNYQPALLDPIEKLFSEYNFGNMKYYTYRKSREQPPHYLELRQRVFIALCILFFVIIAWILTCFFIKEQSQKIHRKKEKVLDAFYESTNLADLRLQAEMKREIEEA